MKYLKTYEKHQIKFRKYDYVIAVGLKYANSALLKNYLENNIGQIVYIHTDINSNNTIYEVWYNNVPKELKFEIMDDIYNYSEDEIRLATPEEIDFYQNINKYNL